MNRDICIIGQGLTGLTAAFRLANTGHNVTIIDQAKENGGLARDLPCGKTSVERIYHHCFAGDLAVAELAAALGLQDQLKWYRPSNGLLSGGRLYPFTTPGDLLSFSPLPPLDRIRTGLTVLRAKSKRDWLALEGTTAASFLMRYSGKTACEKLWEPLLRSKFGEHADRVSAVWIWNKFKLRGGSRQGLKDEMLGYLDGGFGRLATVLADRLEKAGVTILNEEKARTIQQTNGGYTVETDKRVIPASVVIAAVAAPVFNRLSAGLDLGSYRDQLDAARYKANLCLLLSFAAPVTPYYWTTVCDELPFVVAVEQTHLIPPELYGGHLIYLSRYLDEQDPLWLKSDDEIERMMTEALFRVFPAAREHYRGILALTRSRYAQPVIPLHYSRLMPPVQTPLPNLFLAGMSQIYPEDRGLNYAIRLGSETAALVLS